MRIRRIDLNRKSLLKRVSSKILGYFPSTILNKLISKKFKSFHYPVVLMFHRVIPDNYMKTYADTFGYEVSELAPFSVTPEKLEEIIVLLKENGFSFLFEDEYQKSKAKQIILTFDDGYTDNYLFAYPILRKHGVKASINIISGKLCDDDKGEFLSIGRVLEMQNSNLIQFQAHTISHPVLTQCTRDVCRREIVDCKKMIYEKTGIMASVFVYPCCQMNREISEWVKQNYLMAYGGNDKETEFIYRIPRIEINANFDKKKLLSNMYFSII